MLKRVANFWIVWYNTEKIIWKGNSFVFRKYISAVLAFVLLVTMVPLGAQESFAAAEFTVSQECVDIIKKFEGFSAKPYWDYGHYTVGYGTMPLSDEDLARYKANGITEKEAEDLLRYYLDVMGASINSFLNKYKIEFTQGQFDALLSFTYNCGTGWLNKDGTLRTAVIEGKTGNDLLFAMGQWCVAGGTVMTGKIKRRLIEANMYLNGEYSMTVPSNYCYVLYDANGGAASVRAQAYDSNFPTAPVATATYDGFKFEGWYTEPDGGTRITELNASTRNDRLYAHWSVDENWKPTEPTEPTEPETQDGILVTVTNNKVNIRSGPGTSYKIVDNVNTGKTMVITETAKGSGYTWGKFADGWIALKYTNYDQVKNGQTVQPTEPKPTEPSVPATSEPTEPATTAPTEPKPTEPKPTEPKPTEPEKTGEKGTITGNKLRIRKGPSTGYAIVGYLNTGDRVEILEKKTVGTTVWGRIANGWISMDYVKLDSDKTPEPTEPKPTEPKPTEPKPTEPADTTITGKIKLTSGRLRIRSGAGTSYSIVGYYSNGDSVKITQKKTVGSTVWGKTEKGWISMSYVTVSSSGGTTQEPDKEQQQPGQTGVMTGTVTSDGVLRIRSGAGTNYSIVGFVKSGAKVTILETKLASTGTTWARIEEGWISMNFVKVTGGQAPETGKDNNAKTGTVTTTLRVRGGPGTNYKIVAYLSKGTKVEILETVTNASGTTWVRIAQGWVSLKYLST